MSFCQYLVERIHFIYIYLFIYLFIYFIKDIDVSSMTGMEPNLNMMNLKSKNSSNLELFNDLQIQSRKFLRCKYTFNN